MEMEVNTLNKQDFLSGGGEAGQIIRSIDWSTTPIGIPATWPQSLQTTIRILLQSHVPMFIAWGPSGTVFFNDVCQPLIEGQSAKAMGHPVQTLFASQWKTLGPVFDQVMLGKPVTLPDVTCSNNRNGYTEPIPYTFSCIPIPNEAGKT